MSDPTYRSSRQRPRWLRWASAVPLLLAGAAAPLYADAPNRRVPAAQPATPAAPATAAPTTPTAKLPPAPAIVVVADTPPPKAPPTPPKDANALPKDANALLKDTNALPKDANALPKDANALPKDANALPKDANALPKNANAPPPAAAPGPTTVVGPGAPPPVPVPPSSAAPKPASPNAAEPNAAPPNDANAPTTTVAVGSSFVPANLLSRRGNLTVTSFAHAKVHLRVLYDERRRTLYSDCVFDRERHIDYSQCSYRPRVFGKRARRVEWEHVVPAEAFGRAFASWRQGDASCVDAEGRPFRGRRCAQRASAAYRHIEADLYNLYPEIGELNQLRSNKPMGEPRRHRRELAAPAATFIGQDAFTPRPAVRGDVARTYRYMNDAYPGLSLLPREREPLLTSWSQADPVDAWECRRAWRIEAIQGNENRFVKTPCLEAGLWPSG